MKKKFDLLSYEPQTKKDLSYLDKFFKIIYFKSLSFY